MRTRLPQWRLRFQGKVLLPMFNESGSITTVISDLRPHFDHIVCVDDGSADDCADLAEQAGALVLRHSAGY